MITLSIIKRLESLPYFIIIRYFLACRFFFRWIKAGRILPIQLQKTTGLFEKMMLGGLIFTHPDNFSAGFGKLLTQ